LSCNGSTTAKASLASYSNYAGSDSAIQKNFLVVGVKGDTTGLYGTSFAAPIISGYAARDRQQVHGSDADADCQSATDDSAYRYAAQLPRQCLRSWRSEPDAGTGAGARVR